MKLCGMGVCMMGYYDLWMMKGGNSICGNIMHMRCINLDWKLLLI